MSSLRISQHRAAIGAAVGTGGNTPADATGDGASFAGALDAAGVGARGPFSQGGTAGDALGDPPASRKRGEPAGNADAATLADIAGSALATLNSAAANAASGGFGALSPTPIATAPATSTGGNRSALSGNAPSVGSASGDNPAALAPGAPAGPLSAALAAAATAGAEAATNPTASADGLGAPDGMQPSSGPAAVSLPERAVTSATDAASVNSSLVGFATAIGRQVPETGTPSGRATDAERVPVASGIAGMDTRLVAASPAMTGTASASYTMPPSDSGGSSALAIDPATGVPAGLVSNISAGASAVTTGDPLPPLGSVRAPSGLVAEVQLPVTLASTGDAARDERGRSQPFGSALDAGLTSTVAAAAPATGTDASSVTVTTSGVPAPDPASPGGVSDQVAAHLVRLVSSGSRDMVMRLRPPELGDVTVRIAVTGRDVAAWFASPQPQVQNAISAAIGQLQTSLGDAGYNLSGAWVGGGAANARQEQSNSPPPAASRVLAAAAAIPSRATAPLPAASGLNIYV